MSASARDYAYVVKLKKDVKMPPPIKKEQVEEAKNYVAKYLIKK
jgi:hypothetical protein